MNVSRRWLEGFLRRPLDPKDVAQRLAALGAAVDAIEPLHPGLEQVVVALVREVQPHPNADRLRLCDVDDGSGTPRHVVCGAPNVAAGKKYPFAPVGVDPARGPHARAAEDPRRGVGGDALLRARTRPRPGARRHPRTRRPTPRRARPSSTRCRWPMNAWWWTSRRTVPTSSATRGSRGSSRSRSEPPSACLWCRRRPARTCRRRSAAARPLPPAASASPSRTPTGCPRFLGAVLRGVRVGTSPEWLRARVESVGMRSINNVVDATNYVMFELNQPMHAYDVSRLQGPAVVARRARAGEKLTTLDGVERALAPSMTVIADAAAAIGVAGVMGGAHSEVSADTTDLFLECAYFEPKGVRATRRTLGLSSEASYRFERGVDLWNGPEVLRRAVEIIQATGGRHARRRAGGPLPAGDPPAAHLPPSRARGPGARRGSSVGRDRAIPGGDRRHRGVQAGRRTHCGGRARMAARPGGGNRPDRGNRPAPRLRQLPDRTAPLPRGRAAQRADRSHRRARCAAGWWPRDCSRSRRCRSGPMPGQTACGC